MHAPYYIKYNHKIVTFNFFLIHINRNLPEIQYS